MVVVSADDDEALTIFVDGGDAMREIELCLERVGAVFIARYSTSCEGTHRSVAQNSANAVIGVVAQ